MLYALSVTGETQIESEWRLTKTTYEDFIEAFAAEHHG